MRLKPVILVLTCGMLFQCGRLLKSEPNYTEIKDAQGRLIELYGNENSWDNDGDFHSFYYYNEKNQLVHERMYFTDTTYLIKHTADYLDLFYSYDEKGDREKEIKIMRMVDDNGHFFRDTLYIDYLKKDTTIYLN